MRIERLGVEAFGKLTGFDGVGGVLPSLVVVLGPNEAGKSTVFEFLTTMLYGFSPASRDLNPFVPWGTDEARGSLDIRLRDGRTARVTRRLRSQPAAQLEVDGETSDLRNHPLPWVDHVPRRVFRQVFAVTLAELASLDEDTWARIQDRVVGSMGASDLRPVREIATELEREAGELWRPNRRGNQRIREVRDELRALRGRRREAVQRDRDLRARVDELERARGVLKARRERRASDQLVIERAQVLLPVRAQLERVAALMEAAGPEDLLSDLPDRPHERLDQAQAELRHQQEELARILEERLDPEGTIARLTPEVRTLLAQRDEITRYVSGSARVVADRERLAELESELATLEANLDRACRELVGSPWASAPREQLLHLPPGSLRSTVERVQRARLQVESAESEDMPTGREGRGVVALLIATTLGGLGLAVWSSVSGATPLATLALVLTAASVAAAWSLARRRSTAARATAEHARRRDQAVAEMERARDAFLGLVGELALAAHHLSYPDRPLVDAVERLHELAEQHRSKAQTREDALARITSAIGQGKVLLSRLRMDTPDSFEPEELTAWLADRLRQAERLEQAAAAAERELANLSRMAERVEGALEAARAQVERLEQASIRFGDVPAAEGLQEAARRMEALERARRLEQELEQSQPDLVLLRKQIEEAKRQGARWLSHDDDLAARRARVLQLQEQIEELERTTSSLEKEIELARGQETADWVDGEIATLEGEAETLERTRDRKWVLAQLLRQADRAFRDEHQPDLVRRAGHHLAHLTNGRYDRILVEETEDTDLFRIAGPGIAGPIPLKPPVSTGTLEQAYLSLRLAIVDHLDQGSEPLPLFIDEVFVNWDSARRARGLEVLAQLAETRQVFVFTCHPFMAEELVGAGAHLVELGQE